jgi:c-di-GMP-binding flagellar brake protein YcgR
VRAFVVASDERETKLTLRPMEGESFMVAPGAKLKVRFLNDFGIHGGHCHVVRVAHNESVELTVGPLLNVTTLQRRDYFRVSVALSAQITVVRSTVANFEGNVDREVTTVDVSAGGAKVTTAFALEPDDRVRFTVFVPSDLQLKLPHLLTCDARVLRREDIGDNRYRLAMQSSFPRETERDKWVQLTLNLQRGRV